MYGAHPAGMTRHLTITTAPSRWPETLVTHTKRRRSSKVSPRRHSARISPTRRVSSSGRRSTFSNGSACRRLSRHGYDSRLRSRQSGAGVPYRVGALAVYDPRTPAASRLAVGLRCMSELRAVLNVLLTTSLAAAVLVSD